MPCLPEEHKRRRQQDGALLHRLPQRARLDLQAARQATCKGVENRTSSAIQCLGPWAPLPLCSTGKFSAAGICRRSAAAVLFSKSGTTSKHSRQQLQRLIALKESSQ